MLRILPYVIALVLAIYCLVEVVQSRGAEVRTLPRWVWGILVLIPFVGAVGWLSVGRPDPSAAVRPAASRRRRRLAPDDDADFLRRLRANPPGDAPPGDAEFRYWEEELRRRDEEGGPR
jgi:hypothetical protein